MMKKTRKLLKTFTCDNFVRYAHFGDANILTVLDGIEIKKGLIHKMIGVNQFEKKLTQIPPGFKKIKMNDIFFACDDRKKQLTKTNSDYQNIKKKHKIQV